MLGLAELNLGQLSRVSFHRQALDALAPPPAEALPGSLAEPNSFDFVFTNPPFGVTVDSHHYAFDRFTTCRKAGGGYKRRQPSEVVFIEQCLRLLKPGGVLAIVLPRSVITNRTLAPARRAIDQLGQVFAVVSLPAETFAVAGTQTTTAVVFFRKHRASPARKAKTPQQTPAPARIAWVDVENVGYDTTGRPREGSQLPAVAPAVHQALGAQSTLPSGDLCRLLPAVGPHETLSRLAALISGNVEDSSAGSPSTGADPSTQRPQAKRLGAPRSRARRTRTLRLGDLLDVVATGKTPARAAYTDGGLFILKVGNLTGHGINWLPRDRNFVDPAEADRRADRPALMLQKDDILLTSSAHAPRYIAKKVDIVTQIPAFAGTRATFVGEVMLLRPTPLQVDPYVLLAYLRHPDTMARLQRMVSGQTAHLMPRDVEAMPVPAQLKKPTAPLRQAAQHLRQEAALNFQLNGIADEIARALSRVRTV
jgi:type I restriction enzyme M protein